MPVASQAQVGLSTVAATRYVTPLREGGSLPGLMEADDDGLYVVKFRGAGQGAKALVAELLAVRKQAGMMLPAPIQAAMTVALGDDDAAAAQREVYRARRAVLEPALCAAGAQIHGSQAGLYLWTTFGERALTTVDHLADLGVLVAPGMFYGDQGGAFVRVALTATD